MENLINFFNPSTTFLFLTKTKPAKAIQIMNFISTSMIGLEMQRVWREEKRKMMWLYNNLKNIKKPKSLENL